MSIKAVLFDADGTLYNHRFGAPPVVYHNLLLKEFERLKESYGMETAKRYVEEYTLKELMLDPDLLYTLDKLKKKNLLLFIISDHDQDCLESIVRSFGIEEFFDEIVTSSKVGGVKRLLKGFEYILEKYSLKSSEAIRVGDSVKRDILPAVAVGIKPLFVVRAHNRCEMKKYYTNIHSLVEIIKYI